MKSFFSLITTMGLLCMSQAQMLAQTNPSAASLPFTLNSQSSASLPTGVAVHKFSSIQTTRTVAVATGDLPNQGSSPSSTTGGWYHLGTDGIGLLASGTNAAGSVVVAINTTGLTNINVSWICKTIKNQASRDNSVALQYRIGTSGNFTNVGSTSTYSSAGNADGHTSATLAETLPIAAENQAVVQVRWIYWESVSTSGSRDKISIDNISITSTVATCNTPGGLTASGITTTDASLSWSAATGALSYEYAVTTSATPPSSGTNTATTSYTASGLSPNTTYYLHVRSVCAGSTFSGWASTSFETLEETAPEESEFVVMTYNLLNYPGSTGASREPSYRTIVDDVQPDLLVVQELSSSAGVSNFLSNVLNYSTSTYSSGTFIDGPDSDNGVFYKTAKFQFISNTAIQTYLRDINQFKLRYIPSGDTLIIYSVHLKASNTAPDEAQRADEADSLRKVTNTLGAGKYFMVCGDFNIYESSEQAYQKLITNGSNVNGKFFDIISMSGTWNNSSYAIHHTQSPRTTSFGGGATGGMDDRFDMFLFSDAIVQAGGIDIVSSTYKAYGNDGLHYNQALNTPPYGMYSSTIASALHDASDHLPVVVTLKATTSGAKSTSINYTLTGTQQAVTIFPNPAHDKLFILSNRTITGPVNFDLYDVSGRSIQRSALRLHEGEAASFDVSGLPTGVYYLKAVQLNEVHKIIIN
jgi:endonuclease/exonuclease/phosphatase family metal-dependent hydrolase